MTQVFRGALIGAVMIVSVNVAAQQPAPGAQQPPPSQPTAPQTQTVPPAGQQPPPAPPAVPGQPPAGSAVSQLPVAPAPVSLGPNCPAPAPPATLPARAFSGQTGILLHQVIPTRVPDFEKVIAYLRDALAKTTNVTLRQQAAGWKMYRVVEPGPNGDVIYAFLLDPAVPCVDYALGPILADAIADPALLQEVWKLYQGSVRSGGTVMNLGDIPVVPPTPVLTPSTTPVTSGQPSTTPGAPGQPSTQKPPASAVPAPSPGVPLDANPNRPPNQ